MQAVRGLPGALRQAIRVLLRSPTFLLAAVLILGLGVGANAAVCHLIDVVLLRPLPVEHAEQLALIQLADTTHWRGRRTSSFPVLSNPLWEALRNAQPDVDGLLAWSSAELHAGAGQERHAIRGLFVNGEFFDVLGIRPALGRVFTVADDRRGCAASVTVVSDGFWRRELGSDPSAVGRSITVNGRSLEVIGVSAPGFAGLEVGRAYDVAVPICSQATLGTEQAWLDDGRVWWLTAMARLRPGQTLRDFNAALAVASRGLFDATTPAGVAAEDARDYRSLRLTAVSGAAGVSGLRATFGDPLMLLLAIAGLVLLLVCSSLGVLVLSRASARRQEFAIRMAIGASTARVIGQIILENVLLAIGGSFVALGACAMFSRLLVGFLGPNVAIDLTLGPQIAGVVVLSTLTACTIFGVIPAWLASGSWRASLSGIVNARGASGLTRGGAIRQGLVATQIAVSLVLLSAAFVFGGTLRNLLAVDSGFQTDDVTVARIDFSRDDARDVTSVSRRRDVLETIRRLPGVLGAAEVRHVPLSGTGTSAVVRVDHANAGVTATVRVNGVSDGYFRTMGIGLTAGRDFTDRDTATSPRVAIVNAAFVRRLGIAGNPVGTHVWMNDGDAIEIVGTTHDTKHFSLREDFLPMAFVPMSQIVDPRPYADFVIQSSAPDAVGRELRAALSGADLDVDLQALEASVDRVLVRERLMAALAAFFGMLGVVITALGVYGVILELVSRRQAELALRIALGATRRDVFGLVCRRVGVLLLVGFTIGALIVFGGTGSVRALVFGVEPLDFAVIGYAAVILIATTALAVFRPACRAALTEPVAALRGD